MADDSRGEITLLLDRWRAGEAAAFDALVPVVYEDLRRLAASMMRRERSDHTLQATALLNETYMRLVQQQMVRWEDRSHFFAFAARLMRNILTDHARARLAWQKPACVRDRHADPAPVHPPSYSLALTPIPCPCRQWLRYPAEVSRCHSRQ